MPSGQIEAPILQDFSRSSRIEWLVANGEGAYAMGTTAGANTRRYHGHLVAPRGEAGERHVLLPRIEEEVFAGGRWVALGCCQYPGAVAPAGHTLLVSFRPAPHPEWRWRIGAVEVTKTLELLRAPHGVRLEYRVSPAVPLRLRVFTADRGYHGLGTGAGSPLHLACPGAVWHETGDWYRNVEYLEELERGFPFREDLWCPGWFEITGRAVLTASLAPTPGMPSTLSGPDAFLSRRANRPTLLAGFPWFTDWGRDTFISLPGLLIHRGRASEAIEIFEGFLDHRRDGLLPNRFPDHTTAPEYNTVDATLWAFEAAHQLWLSGATGRRWVETVFCPIAREILDWHLRGTLYGIAADPADGLLTAGSETTQLTWMDARSNGVPVTPRFGKAVEINALWYNALRLMAIWGDHGYTALADRVAESFPAAFWNAELGYLDDLAGRDAALRPNQILAVSLTHPLLTPALRRRLLLAVRLHLVTPFGLRTLASEDPRFVPRYAGPPEVRDAAYHQGTVWPWLAAPFSVAWQREFGTSFPFPELALEPGRGCLGYVSEIFDATPPYARRGAPAQAWSVAALLELARAR